MSWLGYPGEDAPSPGHKAAERPRTDPQGGGLQLRRDSACRLYMLRHELRATETRTPTHLVIYLMS
jgi:hypothetical protein